MSAPTRRQVAAAFGAILRTARTGADLSQEQLAARADMDPTYPSLLERGRRQPTLYVLLCLSAALDIQASQLVQMTVGRLVRIDNTSGESR